MKYFAFIKISLVFFMCLFVIPSISLVSAAEVSLRANGKIAFQSNRDGNLEIYVMNSDGTGQTRITDNNAEDWNDSWSPDGTKIVFTSNRDGNYEIYVMNADGSGQTRLTNNNSYDGQARFSPDGTRLVFVSGRDGNWEIYVMNADGSGQIRLTNGNYIDGVPCWSPDGTKIQFDSDRDGTYQIYVMNADGSEQTRLTSGNYGNGEADWSPDGTRFAFGSGRDGNYELYVMNADGSGQMRLTNNNNSDENAKWSPDGTKIVFESDRDGNDEIYVMNADGSGQKRLTNNPASDRRASWQSLFKTSFQQTGIGSDFSGNALTVDNVSYNTNQIPVSLPWSPGTSHTFSWTSPVTVSADKRYVWSSSSGVSTEKSGTLIATSKGDSIIANYIAQYYVRFETSLGGSIAQSSDWYNASSAVAVSATPSTGYSFSNWTVTGSVSVTDAAGKNTNLTINGSGSITANFTVATFKISASAGSGGSISPSGTVAVNYSTNQSFTVTPTTGYNIADVLIDGTSVGALGSYTFTNVASNHSIAASFAPSSTAPSTSTSTTSTTTSRTANWGLIIGIIIAVVVVVSIIFFILMRKRKSKEQS